MTEMLITAVVGLIAGAWIGYRMRGAEIQKQASELAAREEWKRRIEATTPATGADLPASLGRRWEPQA